MTTESKETYDQKYNRMVEENRQRRAQGRVIVRAREVELDTWERRGHEGKYLVDPENGFDTRTMRAHLSEIKPGTFGGCHRHTNEAIIRILEGRGHSLINGERVDWEAGDVLFVPVLAWHQHFNDDPDKRVLYYAVTTVPLTQHLGYFRIDYPEDVPEQERPSRWEPVQRRKRQE
jgi:gentisate 1,2-dioxygenase